MATPPPPPPSSCFSDDENPESLSSNISTAGSSPSTDSDSEDNSKVGPSPVRSSHGSVLRPISSDPKKVLYEFYETVGPHQRDPLSSRIEQLAQECPDLMTLDSSSLHPVSWMSIAWYPIYSIPSNGQHVSDLGACFLTFHSLALPPHHSLSWQPGAQPLPPAMPQSASAFDVRQKRALSSLQSSSVDAHAAHANSNLTEDCKKDSAERRQVSMEFLRPFGFMPYKMQGWCWQDRAPLHKVHHEMMAAAAMWVERRGVSHPDMDFFIRRSGFALPSGRR